MISTRAAQETIKVHEMVYTQFHERGGHMSPWQLPGAEQIPQPEPSPELADNHTYLTGLLRSVEDAINQDERDFDLATMNGDPETLLRYANLLDAQKAVQRYLEYRALDSGYRDCASSEALLVDVLASIDDIREVIGGFCRDIAEEKAYLDAGGNPIQTIQYAGGGVLHVDVPRTLADLRQRRDTQRELLRRAVALRWFLETKAAAQH